jgi:hypothetical protein
MYLGVPYWDTAIPVGGLWPSPFVSPASRWAGRLPNQRSSYGAPTIAARLGMADVSGTMISQACTTKGVISVTVIHTQDSVSVIHLLALCQAYDRVRGLAPTLSRDRAMDGDVNAVLTSLRNGDLLAGL